MSGDAAKLFVSAQLSGSYKKYRPEYPTLLAALLREYAAVAQWDRSGLPASSASDSVFDSAVDIAAGSGQFTRLISPLVRESRLVALDVSPTQVEQGRVELPGVTWMVGTAEATGLQAGAFALVTVAEALHWMDIPAFYAEAARLLAPGGTLCVAGYAGSVIADHAAANSAFYKTWETLLGPYWDPKKQIIENQYVGYEPPPSLFERIERHDSRSMPESMWMEKRWTVDDAVGFCESWSGYNTYCVRHGVVKGSAEDPAVILRADLETALSLPGAPSSSFIMRWPLVMLLATKRR